MMEFLYQWINLKFSISEFWKYCCCCRVLVDEDIVLEQMWWMCKFVGCGSLIFSVIIDIWEVL